MPEFPEVAIQVQYLRQQCVDWTIEQFCPLEGCRHFKSFARSERTKTIRPFFAGNKIESVYQRGKFVVFSTTRGIMLSHLMYRGRWSVQDEPFVSNYKHHRQPPTERTVSFWVQNTAGRRLNFHTPQNLAYIAVYPGETDFTRVEELAPLGSDVIRTPLAVPGVKAWTLAEFARQTAASRQPIGAFLLDQKKVAGIGRTYAREFLLAAGIDARLPANALSSDQIRKLFRAAGTILRLAIKTNLDYSRVFKAPIEKPANRESAKRQSNASKQRKGR